MDLPQLDAPINPNPVVYERGHGGGGGGGGGAGGGGASLSEAWRDTPVGEVDEVDVYEIIREIKDPEHPYTLEELNVVRESDITVRRGDDGETRIRIGFTPTVPHCSLAALIGLCLRVKLARDLPKACKVDLYITPGAHDAADDVTRQVNDKERVAGALENPALRPLVEQCVRDPHADCV